MNDKLQLAEAEAAHRASRAAELMRAGVTVIDPARLDVRGTVSCGRDVVLDVNVILEGKGEARRPRESRRGLRASRLRARRRLRSAHEQPGRGRDRRQPAASSARSRACARARASRTACTSGISSRSRTASIGARQQGEPPDVSRRHRRSGARSTSAPARSPATTTARTSTARKSATAPSSAQARCSSRRCRSARTRRSARARPSRSQAPAGKLTVERSRQVTIDNWKRPERLPSSGDALSASPWKCEKAISTCISSRASRFTADSTTRMWTAISEALPASMAFARCSPRATACSAA